MKVLISRLFKEEYLDEYRIPHLVDRATGRTTGIALGFMSKAIKEPGHWIMLEDHVDSFEARRILLRKVQEIVERLGLDWFQFSSNPPRIRYCPYVEYEKEIRVVYKRNSV